MQITLNVTTVAHEDQNFKIIPRTDVVTFDFKGTGVRCLVCGTFGYQINFFLVHNFAKCSRFVMIIV